MEFFFFDIIMAGLGRLYLMGRYRQKERISQVLDQEYEGSYSNAGTALLLNLAAVFLMLLLLGFKTGVIISFLK